MNKMQVLPITLVQILPPPSQVNFSSHKHALSCHIVVWLIPYITMSYSCPNPLCPTHQKTWPTQSAMHHHLSQSSECHKALHAARQMDNNIVVNQDFNVQSSPHQLILAKSNQHHLRCQKPRNLQNFILKSRYILSNGFVS